MFTWIMRNLKISAFLISVIFIEGCESNSVALERALKYRRQIEARAAEPRDTIFVHHSECTECMDVYVDSGTVRIPDNLRKYFGSKSEVRDVLLAGDFPDHLINT